MRDVRFYLRKPQKTKQNPKPNPSRENTIYLKFKYHNLQLVYAVGEFVKPADWNGKTHRLRSNATTSQDGKQFLNDLLDNLAAVVRSEYNKQIVNGIPQPSVLKSALDAYMNKNVQTATSSTTLFQLIDKFISGAIGERKTPATLTTYRTAKKHLQDFQTATGYKVDFGTINLDFKDAYVKYLEKNKTVKVGKKTRKVPGMKANSVYKEIKNIKTFMNMAVERGYTTNLAYKSKKFGVKEAETDAVYLTEKEIRNLFKFNFGNNIRLETVKDVFVFSSFVGLRYSDACRIKPENIVKRDGDDYIKITSQKTGKPVTIPCNDIVLKIFKKYNPLPAPISNQKFNQYLKEVGELAGLTETGRLASDLSKPLYQVISSHTARRNFATNCYLSGMDSRMIMAVTGHTTEKSFEKYIKVTRDENAKRMGAHMKKGLSQKILKAV